MGTRSRIGKIQADGTILSIYCHWDGYLDGVGETLHEFYQDDSKIDQLIALGDMSSIGAELGEAHDFDARSDNACTFYGRDRGETGIKAISTPSEAEFWKNRRRSGAEYLYLRKDGAWWAQASYPDTETPKLLSVALVAA